MILDYSPARLPRSTFRAWPHEVEKTRGWNSLKSVASANCQPFRLSMSGRPLGIPDPPAAPLEFPTAGQGDDVLGRA